MRYIPPQQLSNLPNVRTSAEDQEGDGLIGKSWDSSCGQAGGTGPVTGAWQLTADPAVFQVLAVVGIGDAIIFRATTLTKGIQC